MQTYICSPNQTDFQTVEAVKKKICNFAYTFQLSLTELKNNEDIAKLADIHGISLDSMKISYNISNRVDFNLGYIFSYKL